MTPDAPATGARDAAPPLLRVRRMGVDTLQEPVVYMRKDCGTCRSEGFEAQSRLRIRAGDREIIATLNVVLDGQVGHGDIGLSECAWIALGVADEAWVAVAHADPLPSLARMRAKVFGEPLDAPAMQAIVSDVAAGRYSDIELAAFVAACAGDRLSLDEIVSLTRAMLATGNRLDWERRTLDKHCVGGLPGNRTTLVVVPIVAAFGCVIPKTSSRAITSPAGTADAMETLAPVDIDLPTMRRVVEREGGCIAWGGRLGLSPADDFFIRIERPLDIDSAGQLVASVLSKKAAAGSTDVLIDVPVGPTAKVRSARAFDGLSATFRAVGDALGIRVQCVSTDGMQPVGRGIGPALEARDVLSVLRRDADAPRDLRERSLALAARILEMDPTVRPGDGLAEATRLLDSGRALAKLHAIREAQGGAREPGIAPHRRTMASASAGRVAAFDLRRLARIAKLAGAPSAPAAGLELHARLGDSVEPGQPLFTIHAETPGELAYSAAYLASAGQPVRVDEKS